VKLLYIIILISILSVFSSGDLESNNSSINYHYYIEKLSDSYKQLVELLTINYNNIIDRFFKPPNYDLQLMEVVTVKECVDNSIDTKQSCILVNLDLKNKQNDSIAFEFRTRTIVTGDGKQLEKYGGLYNTRQLNALCDTPNFFKLFPNATKNVGICFPPVTKEDHPIMYISVMANGKQKEHSFDLTPMISQ
jgi:hypothetical protein